MSKPEPGQDRIQREIEELLDKLDTFVPEERLADKIKNRNRNKREKPPGAAPQPGLMSRLSRVSLGQMMLAGIVLMLGAYFFRAPLGGAASWVMIAGLLISGAAFVMTLLSGGAAHTVTGKPTYEKRWRGQTIEYGEPTAADKLRGWFRNRRRR